MFKATLSKINLLSDSISTIGELIDEATFKITKQGMTLIAADRAMVAVVDFKIDASAFDKFEVDKEEAIGLNITNFLSVLKRAGGSDKIHFNLTDSKLELLLEGTTKRKFVLPLIDLGKEEVPPVEQLEEQFTTTIKLKPEVLQAGIADAEIVADSVVFECNSSRFLMRAEGDISQTELELEKGSEALIEMKSNNAAKSRYPLDYLKKMIKAAKLTDVVLLQFGQDFPIKLSFKSADEKVNLIMVLAPRVSESE
jgi:proliferating cell nuclear antigen